jgi:hypothetical protein
MFLHSWQASGYVWCIIYHEISSLRCIQ